LQEQHFINTHLPLAALSPDLSNGLCRLRFGLRCWQQFGLLLTAAVSRAGSIEVQLAAEARAAAQQLHDMPELLKRGDLFPVSPATSRDVDGLMRRLSTQNAATIRYTMPVLERVLRDLSIAKGVWNPRNAFLLACAAPTIIKALAVWRYRLDLVLAALSAKEKEVADAGGEVNRALLYGPTPHKAVLSLDQMLKELAKLQHACKGLKKQLGSVCVLLGTSLAIVQHAAAAETQILQYQQLSQLCGKLLHVWALQLVCALPRPGDQILPFYAALAEPVYE
jgi:hypothetical protein